MKTWLKNLLVIPVLIAGLGLIPVERGTAQTFTNLHNFASGVANGRVPGAVIVANNILYGTTYFGGSADRGTVFKMNTDGTGYTNLYGFSPLFGAGTNSDGAHPGGAYVLNSTLVLSGGGLLYGTTFGGGKFAKGTVFKVNVDGTGFTNIHNFTGVEGAVPNAGLVLAGNTLYGVATEGGTAGMGTVFKLTTNGTGVVVLHEFSDILSNAQSTNSDGAQPIGGLLLSGNMLYGTAYLGGTLGNGNVFAVNINGTGFTNLHNFDASGFPSGPLILSGNILYGTAYSVIFAVNTNGLGFTNLFTFPATSVAAPFTNSTGINLSGGLILSGSTLYGTASGGGSFGNGTVFAINTNGLGFVALFNFPAASGPPPYSTNNDGAVPSGGLALSGNTLYGTANTGGSSGYGTVFSLLLPAPPLLTIVRSGANVVLRWPTNAASLMFTLQSTTNLLSLTNWSAVSPHPVIATGQNSVTNPVSSAQKFYRLSQ